jgi:L-methionine (R)-S-oxide reductase
LKIGLVRFSPYAIKYDKKKGDNINADSNSNFSNTSSLLWHAYHSLPSPSSSVNWAGFYFTDPSNPKKLILGPFQGQVACQIIAFGRGVCGTAALTQTTQLVDDVDKYPGHIACDGASKSEVVVPIVQDGKVCLTCSMVDMDDGDANDDNRPSRLSILIVRR